MRKQFRLIARARQALRGDAEVRAAWLVGSFAQGTAAATSDVDLCVLVDADRLDEVVGRGHHLLERLGSPILALKRDGSILAPGAPCLVALYGGLVRLTIFYLDASRLQPSHHHFRNISILLDRDGFAHALREQSRTARNVADAASFMARAAPYFWIEMVEVLHEIAVGRYAEALVRLDTQRLYHLVYPLRLMLEGEVEWESFGTLRGLEASLESAPWAKRALAATYAEPERASLLRAASAAIDLFEHCELHLNRESRTAQAVVESIRSRLLAAHDEVPLLPRRALSGE